jgi:hypothetical protein
VSRTKTDAERWRERAEAERQQGLGEREAGGRWLTARDAGRAYQPGTHWRAKPISPAQTRALRKLGLNPLTYRNAGEASDAITRAGHGTKR